MRAKSFSGQRAVLLGTFLAFSFALPAQPQQPTKQQPRRPVKVQMAKTQDIFRKSLVQLPHPAPGCYTASYPRVEWKPVACGEPPKYPIMPARSPGKHFVVGGGASNDFSSHPAGTINAVEGTFPSVSAGITESGPIANTGPNVTDAYTLQINTNQFSGGLCSASPNVNCKSWEQFVYVNDPSSHYAFIQYWLIQYNAPCPSASWTQFSFTGSPDIYCYQSTGTHSLAAGHPVSDFTTLSLNASATATTDQVVMFAGANSAMVMGNNAVALAGGWTDAEFNVFGDGGSSAGGGQAGFGANTTITVKNVVHNGTRNVPGCTLESLTGESNNLTLVGMLPIGIQPSPTIEFTESNIAGSVASCATAAGIGDTHLSTFGGLLYDFQASGDFVLAQTKDFTVQNRQVSGAPTWPNATVSKAVGTQMGATRVAFCTEPWRVAINGEFKQIPENQPMSLPGGVDILRTGNSYVVIDQIGNSLSAEDNGTYINAHIGLGRWPANVTGVLANAKGNPKQIAARTGAVLTTPFAFTQLYHEFADSWRVSQQEESLLSPCGRRVETGIPQKPFTIADLEPPVARRARVTCAQAGVKAPSLLDACVLDVAFFGNESAAKAFTSLKPPVAVGRIVGSKRY